MKDDRHPCDRGVPHLHPVDVRRLMERLAAEEEADGRFARPWLPLDGDDAEWSGLGRSPRLPPGGALLAVALVLLAASAALLGLALLDALLAAVARAAEARGPW